MHYYLNHLYQLSQQDTFWGISTTGWSAITSIITFCAVIVALFQDRIRMLWNKSNLDFKINLTPPDCHKIQMVSITENQKQSFDVIYLRIRVTHLSGNPAENVEIMLTNFWQIDDIGNKKPVTHFLPMNLTWSHFQPRTHVMRIPAGLFRHCDFGFIVNTSGGNILKLDTITQPNKVEDGQIPNFIDSGKYQFELQISGDNVKSKNKIFELELDKKWSDNEADMLNNKIKIKELI